MEKSPAPNFISMLTNGFKNGFIWGARFHRKMKPRFHRFHLAVSFMQPLEALILKGSSKVISRLCNRCETISLAVACIPPVFRRGGMQPMAARVQKRAKKTGDVK